MAKLTAIEKQLRALLIAHQKLAVPKNSRRALRNGNGMPLVSWLHCATRIKGSAIDGVLFGRANSRFYSFGAAAMFLADKIATRYPMTNAQYQFLIAHVFQHYRGKAPDKSEFSPKFVVTAPNFGGSRWRVFDWFTDQLQVVHKLPLRAIIDPKVTDLILLYELQDAISHSINSRTQHGCQPAYDLR